ncbi:hypothetical protein ACFL27_12685 [candidate division CSSED10-310 bacterium]|uniref:Histidine kinase N-terminal 7TM region domain-containing protein n=1 Tax=candidate division CSSED10-310 bacterium TaxID=2855610 RepID=A0ABV6YXY3_UNCC1
MEIMDIVGVWVAAFLTLCIFSFLYKDNPFYKFAEHLFVGVSAGYWACLYYHQTIYPKMLKPLFYFGAEDWSAYNLFLLIPLALSVMMLLRLVPKQLADISWVSRWPIAFMVGTGSGIFFIGYMRSNVIEQIESSLIPIEYTGTTYPQWAGLLGVIIIIFGTFTGLVYFFFSKAHTGLFGILAKIGIYFLMISFGASFGYTVMARISLLIGRMQFLLFQWIYPTFNLKLPF